jgi:hypothetical protein
MGAFLVEFAGGLNPWTMARPHMNRLWQDLAKFR